MVKGTEVILVNKKDNKTGKGEKLQVHRQGKLHRAFSVFIFNSKGEMLLQQRVKSKYHSGGLWSNACCSHPKPGEKTRTAAKKRLKEEMGFTCELKKIFSFIYKAKLGALTEYEFDHIFLGRFDGEPKPNKKEVRSWKWINLRQLKRDIKKNPEKYTFWFKRALDRVINYIKENSSRTGKKTM